MGTDHAQGLRVDPGGGLYTPPAIELCLFRQGPALLQPPCQVVLDHLKHMRASPGYAAAPHQGNDSFAQRLRHPDIIPPTDLDLVARRLCTSLIIILWATCSEQHNRDAESAWVQFEIQSRGSSCRPGSGLKSRAAGGAPAPHKLWVILTTKMCLLAAQFASHSIR